jgi:hypothetical protein
LRIQFGGWVKKRAAGRVGFEHAINDDAVEVEMGIEQRAEAMDEDDGTKTGLFARAGAG